MFYSAIDCLFACLLAILRKKNTDRIFINMFTVDISLEKEVTVKFWKSSGLGVWIRTPDADQSPWRTDLRSSSVVFFENVYNVDPV